MKSTLIGVFVGALIVGVPAGFIGLTLVSGQPEAEPRWLAGLLGFLTTGVIGAVPGGIAGGVGGLIVAAVRRTRSAIPYSAAPFAYQSAALLPATEPPLQGYWIGTIGESLETRATVDSVEPVRDPYAHRELRWLHRLKTPTQHRLRWLANHDRGLSAGDKIVLEGTVKDHTWADAGSVTEMWHCRTRKDTNEN